MRRASNTAWGATFAALLVFSAMGEKPEVPPRRRAAVYTAYSHRLDELSDAQLKRLARHCFQGVPTHDKAAAPGPTRYVAHEGYALEHSSELLFPLWVSEHLTAKGLKGKFDSRHASNPFAADPDLKDWPHALPADYAKSHFDQGHMTPDANHTTSEKEKRETYYMSNMVPQAGEKFNRLKWKELETRVREWAAHRGECWIFTGGFIHDPAEEDAGTADGVVEYFTVGPRAVAIPTHLYKIVVAPKVGVRDPADDDWECLAFVMENRSYEKDDDLAEYLTTIDWIEERTGLNFMPDLPATVQDSLERSEADELWTVPKD